MAPILAIRAISHAPFLRSRVAWPRAISQIASWKHAVRSRVRLCVSNMPPRGRPTHELHSRRLAIATPCHRHRLTLPLAPRRVTLQLCCHPRPRRLTFASHKIRKGSYVTLQKLKVHPFNATLQKSHVLFSWFASWKLQPFPSKNFQQNLSSFLLVITLYLYH